MIYLFDKNDRFLSKTDNFENDIYKRKVNNEFTFTFEIPLDDENVEYIKRKNKVGLYNKDDEFQLFVIEDLEFDYINNTLDVSCLHDFYTLNDTIIENLQLNEVNASTAITNILNKSSYTCGNIADLGIKSINVSFKSILNSLNNIIKLFGGEFDFRYELDNNQISRKIIDLKYRLGKDTGLRFTYDTNLKTINKSISKDNHFTVIYGQGYSLGKDKHGNDRFLDFGDIEWIEGTNPISKPIDIKFIEDKNAIAKYGRIEGVFRDTNIQKKNQLIEKSYEKLQQCKEPKVSYSATVEEISHLIGYEHYKSRLGDTIIIVDEEHDLVVEARIIDEEYSIKDISNIKIVLGNFLTCFTDDVVGDMNDIKDKVDNIDPEIDDSKFPDTLPPIPVVTAHGIFSSITIEWTYENKLYYNYEVYASKIKNFVPDSTNLIYKGQSSAFLHEVKPRETWYYRVRAGNTHNKFTDYSAQISESTTKLTDAAEYFEEAAISHALIGSLNADKIIAGKVKGTYIDAKNLSVTDGNGKRTLDIDSFGNVNLDATTIKMASNGKININTENFYIDNLELGFRQKNIKTFGIRGGYAQLYNPQDATLMGAMVPRSTIGGGVWANGISTVVSNNGYFYSIAKAFDWNGDGDITFNPREYFVLNFRDVDSTISGREGGHFHTMFYAHDGINLARASITNCDTVTSNNISCLSYRHPNGNEMFSSDGYNMNNRRGWNWNRNNLLDPNIIGGSYGYSIETAKAMQKINNVNLADVLDNINIYPTQSVYKKNTNVSLEIDVANLRGHENEDLFIKKYEVEDSQTGEKDIVENIDMKSMLHLSLLEIKNLKEEVRILKEKVGVL